MCIEVKFYYEKLLKGEWRAKTSHPPQNMWKWKEQHKIEKDGGLQIEEEC